MNKFSTLPTLMSTYSVHDYHSFGIHGTGHATGLHFHLAATINALTGVIKVRMSQMLPLTIARFDLQQIFRLFQP